MSNWQNEIKGGNAWEYNENGYAYNQANDPQTNDAVTYNQSGILNIWANQQKS